MTSTRPILTSFSNPEKHWVGDGFLTQSLLPPQHAADVSPFLLAGYNAPLWFDATDRPKGIGMHPHRGFETVTIAFQGGVAHGDTLGNRGEIGPGDVQWMTAASGVQHEEHHSELITAHGGVLEMVQLWVNLPASHKRLAPRYQNIAAADIPTATLAGGGSLRVIAGAFDGLKGPEETATPLQLWDLRLPAGATQRLDLPEGQSVAVLALQGQLTLNGVQPLPSPGSVIFSRDAGVIDLAAKDDAHFLVLAGEPINEPIVMGGPFVMNSQDELRDAYRDFRDGLF